MITCPALTPTIPRSPAPISSAGTVRNQTPGSPLACSAGQPPRGRCRRSVNDPRQAEHGQQAHGGAAPTTARRSHMDQRVARVASSTHAGTLRVISRPIVRVKASARPARVGRPGRSRRTIPAAPPANGGNGQLEMLNASWYRPRWPALASRQQSPNRLNHTQREQARRGQRQAVWSS